MFTDAAPVTGPLLRELRTVAGIGLRQMAIRTAFAPSYLSMVETGTKPVTAPVLKAYRDILGDPVLGLGVDVARLATPGATTLTDVETILARSRRLEDTAGAHLVVAMARGLDGLARVLAGHTDTAAPLASETARFRGWLELASGHPHLANKALADSIVLADTTGDPSQRAHARSFRAYALREAGAPARALDLVDDALTIGAVHPMLRVYDLYARAKYLAALGDTAAALRALPKADRAAGHLDYRDPPPYSYWLTPGFLGLQRGRVLWIAGQRNGARGEVLAGLDALPPADREASWAGKWRAVADGADVPG
ncbi:helix-turn-helix transcriptional regulator [Nocardia sp. NPDC051030]|uniref:helix-turn-helix domain-containing protein n=1 Tax=Nocardia sp. NPDC051030 TaxID=3155162 RepID=UPI00343E3E16